MPYLDHAGATLPSRKQIEEISSLFQSLSLSNPHSHHSTSRVTNNIVNNARQRILSFFSTTSDDHAVIFTLNATHALKIVAESFEFGKKKSTECQFAHSLEEGSCFAYLLDSHNSVLGMRELVKDKVDTVCCLPEVPEAIPASDGSSLFALTCMSNFSGYKYNLNLVNKLKDQGWFVCLDAAALISSSSLNLSNVKADFTAISFYKLFGYPSGLGALIVRRDSVSKLIKRQFSGGTVAFLIPDQFVVKQKTKIEERFEDGTQNYYGIAALQKGFDDIENFGGMDKIQDYTLEILKQAYDMLSNKFHWNGQAAVEIYLQEKKISRNQGPILSFNLLNEDGNYVGFSEVSKMADLFGIDLRTGCFCNVGACQKFLSLTQKELELNIESGKECGDNIDIINGKPTGAVRISFGRSTRKEDLTVLEQMIDFCFIRAHRNVDIEHPLPISSFNPSISKLFCYPIKSCRGFSVDRAQFTLTGLKYDRNFMIVSNDITLSQKKYPQLCHLSTDIRNGAVLISSCNNTETISVPLEVLTSDKKVSNIVCSDTVSVENCGPEVGLWLDSVLDMSSCQLRRVVQDSSRSLSNEAPYLLVNESSVLLLAEEIGLTLDEAITRFRPNLVIKGLPPFLEDTASTVIINNTKFKVTGKCNRCEMICVDQITGEKNPAMIIALRSMRNREKMTFGIYLQEVGNEQNFVNVNDQVVFE